MKPRNTTQIALHKTHLRFLFTRSNQRPINMAMEVEQPESLDTGGKFADKPGIYHAVCVAVDENPASRDGAPLDGTQVTFSILAGTNADQKDKTIEVILWTPDKDDDKTAMVRKRQTAFCLATCLIGQFQPGVKTTVDPMDAVGRQCVLKLAFKQKKDETSGEWVDTKRLDLAYADIWHVDHENVASNNVPLDQAAIRIIPAELRKQKTAAAPASKAAGAVDLSDV